MSDNLINEYRVSKKNLDKIDILKLYTETYANIRETDQISFKLLGFVPLISGSGAGVLVFLLEKNVLGLLPTILLSVISSIITFGLYRWELRNIQTCSRLLKRAKFLEQRIGLGELAGREEAPRFLGRPIGKTEAEKIIYIASVIAWLVPIVVAFSR